MIGVKTVEPLSDYRLKLKFDNGEEKIFDMKPYLEHGIFQELKDEKLFRTVHISFDTIKWNNGADICPEALYNQL